MSLSKIYVLGWSYLLVLGFTQTEIDARLKTTLFFLGFLTYLFALIKTVFFKDKLDRVIEENNKYLLSELNKLREEVEKLKKEKSP